jgi:hypothetical protein
VPKRAPPIPDRDIRSPKQTDLAAIEFNYKLSPLHIVDNGHKTVVSPSDFICEAPIEAMKY